MRGAIATGLVLALLGAGQGYGQEARAPFRSPILTLDQERLFAESRRGRAVLGALEADTAALSAENRRIEAELTAEEKALTVQRPSLSPEEFRALAEAFDQKVVAIRREQDAKARALALRRETDQQAFFREVLPLLAEIVGRRGAVAVLERGAVILSAEPVDITDEAIELIDARLGPETEDAGGAEPLEDTEGGGGGGPPDEPASDADGAAAD